MKKLEKLIVKLESKIADHERLDPQVSTASIGWHIEHSLLTLDTIIHALARSNPANYKRSFSIRRTVVMLAGKFPRGRIKAPTAVRPANDFNFETLHQHILFTKRGLQTLQHLTAGHYFTHPFLGDFKLNSAIQFMRVHTNHHLHIINDISKGK